MITRAGFAIVALVVLGFSQAHASSEFEACINRISHDVADEEKYTDMLADLQTNNHLGDFTALNHMTNDEAVAIYAYARDFFDPVNATLWAHHDATYSCFIPVLDSALDRLPDFQGTVYRGASLPASSLAQHVPQRVIPYLGYTSASYGEISDNFSDKPVFLTIHSLHGKKIESLTVVQGDEREVLFRHGTRFRVLSRSGHNPVKIEMEEVSD